LSLRWDDIYATNNVIQTSDESFKKNIKTIDDRVALDIVRRLEPIQSKHKGGGKRWHWSFGANQLAEAMRGAGLNPDHYGAFIDPTKGGKPFEPVNDDDTRTPEDLPKGLRAHELVPLLWSAVQQLDRKVAALEAA
jgi:hypothetical protein